MDKVFSCAFATGGLQRHWLLKYLLSQLIPFLLEFVWELHDLAVKYSGSYINK